jgi:hypothetical protein
MAAWRVEYIASLKLEIENKLIIELKNAEDAAARALADRIAELKATMEIEITRLTTWYD